MYLLHWCDGCDPGLLQETAGNRRHVYPLQTFTSSRQNLSNTQKLQREYLERILSRQQDAPMVQPALREDNNMMLKKGRQPHSSPLQSVRKNVHTQIIHRRGDTHAEELQAGN